MARRSSLLLLAVLIQLLGPTRLDAQRTLSGVVRDTGGSLLPGVSVRATSPALAEPRSVLTNLEGRYSFGDIPDGTYTLTFALRGFVEITRSDIALPQAGESSLDVVMRVGPLAETITILRGTRAGIRLNPQGPPAAACTMRVMPTDPSIDQKMLKKPDTAKDYTLQVLPPRCQASHPAQPR
jgi:Carboxypeptidase regulatory-like domain